MWKFLMELSGSRKTDLGEWCLSISNRTASVNNCSHRRNEEVFETFPFLEINSKSTCWTFTLLLKTKVSSGVLNQCWLSRNSPWSSQVQAWMHPTKSSLTSFRVNKTFAPGERKSPGRVHSMSLVELPVLSSFVSVLTLEGLHYHVWLFQGILPKIKIEID